MEEAGGDRAVVGLPCTMRIPKYVERIDTKLESSSLKVRVRHKKLCAIGFRYNGLGTSTQDCKQEQLLQCRGAKGALLFPADMSDQHSIPGGILSRPLPSTRYKNLPRSTYTPRTHKRPR